MNEESCYFCGTQCEHIREASGSRDYYSCKNCGQYYLTDYVKGTIATDKHILAGYLFETKHNRVIPCKIESQTLSYILHDPIIPKTTMQKLQKLLLFYYRSNEYIGEQHIFRRTDVSSIAYAKDSTEVFGMLFALEELGYLQLECTQQENPQRIQQMSFVITCNGLVRAEELLSTNIDSNKVFVAMGFKPDLLKALKEAIKPACEECGFEAFIISDKEHNNCITDEIITAIKVSKFMITDLTYNNCGAYFEAGFAQGCGQEVICCCKKEWFDGVDKAGNKNHLHFDVSHYNFILWENAEDLKIKLLNRIRANIEGAKLTYSCTNYVDE